VSGGGTDGTQNVAPHQNAVKKGSKPRRSVPRWQPVRVHAPDVSQLVYVTYVMYTSVAGS
jgi:hypothetical protein